MNISNLGLRSSAVSLLRGKNGSYSANDVANIKTKMPSTAKVEADKNDKRTQALRVGLESLESMPSPRQIAKQGAANRVGLLQRRMEALKMLLLRASPEQAKLLARELKSIAGELSSAAKALGGGSGSTRQEARIVGRNIGTAESAGAEALAGSAGVAADEPKLERQNTFLGNLAHQVAPTEQKPESETDTFPPTADQDSPDRHHSDASSDEIDAGVLRGLLMDAKKTLKEIINMLKPKLAGAGKEAKKDLLDAEKKLSEIERSLQENVSANAYTGLGGDVASPNLSVFSGSIVNITA